MHFEWVFLIPCEITGGSGKKLSGRFAAPADAARRAGVVQGSVRVDSIGFGWVRAGGRRRGAGGARAEPDSGRVPVRRKTRLGPRFPGPGGAGAGQILQTSDLLLYEFLIGEIVHTAVI